MIQTVHLTKKYNSFLAVEDLSLTVNNELFVFLGPNGAGKTTTIKMMTGLLQPTHGSVSIHGIDLHKNPIQAKQCFGLVQEQAHVYEKLTAREFIQFIASIYHVPVPKANQKMEQLFEIFEISDWTNDLIEDFSHGMKQKVALTAALVHDPKVLFLDEPTVGLDPKAARNLKELLRGLVNKGNTVFMSTHILEVAERMCDRIGIIHKGKLVALGTLDDLREKASIQSGNLEDVFLKLTGSSEMANVAKYLEEA